MGAINAAEPPATLDELSAKILRRLSRMANAEHDGEQFSIGQGFCPGPDELLARTFVFRPVFDGLPRGGIPARTG